MESASPILVYVLTYVYVFHGSDAFGCTRHEKNVSKDSIRCECQVIDYLVMQRGICILFSESW